MGTGLRAQMGTPGVREPGFCEIFYLPRPEGVGDFRPGHGNRFARAKLFAWGKYGEARSLRARAPSARTLGRA